MPTFIERHADKIRGVLSCFDRVVLTGTLPDLCHADAMARFLGARQLRVFDYPRWAEPFRDTIRRHAEQLAQESSKISVGELAADYVQLSGPSEAILGVVVVHQQTMWFVKLQGDPALAARVKERFESFARSLRFDA